MIAVEWEQDVSMATGTRRENNGIFI